MAKHDRPKQATIKTMNKKQRARAKELCAQLPLIQHELFTLGLIITSTHMAKTIEKLGYELCLADLHAGRTTDSAKRQDKLILDRDGEKALSAHRSETLRGAEKMLYPRGNG